MNESVDMVLFGGAGDLALRKLVPALFRACVEGSLGEDSRIIATCRSSAEVANYRAMVFRALETWLAPDECSDKAWQVFSTMLQAVQLDISAGVDSWQPLIGQLPDPGRVRVFYLAVPPAIYGVCCERLSQAGLVTPLSRLVVEKPIGYDSASALHINDKIARFLPEESVFRIDHYLGKETVQNLMALRFSNLLFERLWDAHSIDNVQINISETVGLEGRAGFYDEAGALRDMVQNHLMQLLCLVAMESPSRLNANSIRAEKMKVLEALRPLRGDEVAANTVRGQYVAGNIDGQLVTGYLEELGRPGSQTETFVAIRAYIDNWRWAKVPFYLRTGKRMKTRGAEIVIQFKEVSHRVYEHDAGPLQPNRLVIQLQPEESIQLTLMAKNLKAREMQLHPAVLNLNFFETYGRYRSDAYKRLILDAAAGNQSLFIHRDEVALAWQWIDPIVAAWRASDEPPCLYRAGSWGPPEADELLEESGHCWFNVHEGGRCNR